MALQRSRMRSVVLKEYVEGVTDEESGYAPEGQPVLANIYPLTSSTAAQMYGERVRSMRLMLVPPGVKLSEFMGICVDVPPDEPPDYKITGSPEAFATHTRAHLEFIPKEKRKTAKVGDGL